MTPSDIIWALPNDKLTIGSRVYSNLGQWNIFSSGKSLIEGVSSAYDI